MSGAKVDLRVLLRHRRFRDTTRRVIRQINLMAAVLEQPRNYDPATGTWRSDICAAWLHERCRHAGACSCRCHRKAKP